MNIDAYRNIIKELSDQKYALDQAAIVATTDHRGVITYVNDKLCEISEYTKEELIGKTHKVLNSGLHEPGFFKNLWETIKEGKIWRGEICNKKKGGDYYWVYTTIVPFVDRDQKPYQYMAIRQDITEFKELQQKILEQQAVLVANSRLSTIGEMAAAVTHEINNPLGVILGRCEMIQNQVHRNDISPDLLERNINAIEKTAKRIEKIIKSMKALSHHSEDEAFSPTSVHTIVEDTLEISSERMKNHSIQLSVKSSKEDLLINSRSYQIVQVLVNLLNNSFDAILNNKERWIEIKTYSNENSVIIEVMDSGKGISREILNKLFEPFFSTKKVQYGTGLGLSISRNIIKQHNGNLEYISSSPNTLFRITLPRFFSAQKV